MAITIPAPRIKTAEEERNAFIALHRSFVVQIKDAIEKLCKHHRKQFEEHLFANEKLKIQRYMDQRKPNETAYDYSLERRHVGLCESERKKEAREYLEHIAKYTTHPRFGFQRQRNDPLYGNEARSCDFTDHGKYRDWLENKDRPKFTVQWMPDADKRIKAEVKQYVNHVIRMFGKKTVEKVIDILVAKDGKYKCKLEYGSFYAGAFEGDITVSFPNGTGFRTHVIVKTNYSYLGNAYTQYPLTFHNVVSETGATPIAMLSQEEVQKSMGVKPWVVPTKQKKPWTAVQVGDLVRTETMSVCMVVGTRGSDATVFHPDTGDARIHGSEIKEIFARTKPNNWSGAIPFLRVTPHEGKAFELSVSTDEAKRVTSMSYGIKQDTEIRKLCLPGLLRSWKDRDKHG